MKSLRAAVLGASARLGNRLEAEVLLAHVLGHDRAWLFAHANDLADAGESAAFQALVARRVAGEPLAYITGSCEFWSLPLRVTAATLIPRPDTECLVAGALERVPVGAKVEVADLGTGSGAVALAIASERPDARLLATDASGAALAVAKDNAARLGLTNVRMAGGDWCAALGAKRFALIVSNPPYIAAADAHLQHGDLRFEPRAALASGGDGLDAIRSIIANALAHLNADGWLLLEHGWTQAEAVRGLLRAGGYADLFTAHDLGGRERVSGARRR